MHFKQMKPRTKSFTILSILLVIFIVPIVVATWLYNNHIILGGKTTNHGMLIEPPLKTKTLGIQPQHKWTLVYLTHTKCQKSCQKSLYYLRQIQKASGKNQNRIQRVLLSYSLNAKQLAQLNTRFPKTQKISTQPSKLTQLFAHNDTLNFAKQAGTQFIVDPDGYLMMAYQPKAQPMDIYKDLQHLLKISQVG